MSSQGESRESEDVEIMDEDETERNEQSQIETKKSDRLLNQTAASIKPRQLSACIN